MSISVIHRDASGFIIRILSVVVISLTIGISIGVLGETGAFLSVAPLMVIAGILVLKRPIWLLYIIPIISVSVSAFREVSLSLGNTKMTLSGFLWFSIAGFVILSLLLHAEKVRMPGYLWPFALFSLWTFIRWIITPTGFLGLKDILWYSMPVLFGLFVPLTLGKDQATFFYNVRSVEKAFLFSALIPVGLYAVALSTGLAEMTSRGPKGELIGDARGTPLYLLIVLSLALGKWRYGPARTQGRTFSLLSLGTILFTLGRMANFLGVLLLALSRVNPRQKWKILIAIFLGVVVFFYAVTHVPVLQQRFFFKEEWDPSMGLRGVNTAGRNILWLITLSSAMEAPGIGHGLGTARLLLGQFLAGKRDVTEHHPHNEYLQVFHDTGLVGLFLVISAWIVVFIRQWNLWKNAKSGVTRRWGMTSAMAVAVVLISSVTDNTLHYSIVVVPAFIIVAIADLVQRVDSYAKQS